MPSLIDAIKQTDSSSLPTIELRRDIVLFMFSSKERANPTARMKAKGIEEGNPYLKGTFVGEDEKGNLTCQKVLNVFFANNKDMITFTGNGDDVEGLGSSALIFLMGQLSFNDIEVDGKLEANQSYSLSASSLCRYNPQGEFYYSEEKEGGKLKGVTLKGTPGAVVTVSLEKSGVMQLAPKLDPTKRPKKSPIRVNTKLSLGKTKPPEEEEFEIKSPSAEETQAERGGEAITDKEKVTA